MPPLVVDRKLGKKWGLALKKGDWARHCPHVGSGSRSECLPACGAGFPGGTMRELSWGDVGATDSQARSRPEALPLGLECGRWRLPLGPLLEAD